MFAEIKIELNWIELNRTVVNALESSLFLHVYTQTQLRRFGD